MRLPKHIKKSVDAATVKGHKLVSQGCAMFRCTGCDHAQFMDNPTEVIYRGPFSQECPGRFKCPYCSRAKESYNVTCTRSECQEANFNENRDRHGMRRKRT
jgi:hypothetical protein